MSKVFYIIFFCTWFPHRLESEDHARPLVLSKVFDIIIIFFVLGFPIGLSSRTMQGLWFCPKFLILLLFFCTWFPHRLESEDYARPWFCPKLFSLFSGISQGAEQEVVLGSDYSSVWAVVPGPHVVRAWAVNLLGPQIRRYFRSLWSRGTFWRPSVRGAPSRGSFNLMVADGVGDRARDILSVAFLGTLRELNAIISSFQINRRADCFTYAQLLQLPPLVNHV